MGSDSTTDTERAEAQRSRGKWSQEGFPHRGWVCVEEYDAGEDESDFVTCGMCESALVRFVHVMENERCPDRLHCGCICAAHMSQDFAGAERREKAMRSLAGRRARFPKRQGWRTSTKGTLYIKVRGFHLMVVKKQDGRFQVGASAPAADRPIWGARRYDTIEAAQKGCFDALIELGA